MSVVTPISLKNAVIASFMGVYDTPKYNESIAELLPVLNRLADVTEEPFDMDGYIHFKIVNGEVEYDLSDGIIGLYNDVFDYLGCVLSNSSNSPPYFMDFLWQKGFCLDLALNKLNSHIVDYFGTRLPDELLKMDWYQLEFWVANNFQGDFSGLTNNLASEASETALLISDVLYAYFVLDRGVYIKWDDKTTSVISANGGSAFIMQVLEGLVFDVDFFLE